ncbi:uncharacterized protein LOC134710752 [Mytilus trossulus]|uniref:uncharacterized protein LOC134710752 n=1 Tax=Mytilus trossulus TaxID=6551 RepID=UPI003006A125
MVELTKVYETDESVISSIKTLENGACVMMNDEENTIKKFILRDGICEFVKIFEGDILYLTVTKEGNILASDGVSEVIYNITESGKERFKSSASPKKARGIHTLGDQSLCVGFVDFENLEVGIAIIDMKSDQYQEFAITPADSIPEKITSNMNGNICVIQSESTSTWKGIIVSYEISPSLGQVNWRYEGNAHINELRDFAPSDIAISHASLVLIVDSSSNIIHVLSSNGCFLTFIGEGEGIYSPRSLNVDNEGRLQIGSDETKDEFAKIYIAKFIT